MRQALKYGVGVAVGIDHPEYRASIESLAPEVRASLVSDLR